MDVLFSEISKRKIDKEKTNIPKSLTKKKDQKSLESKNQIILSEDEENETKETQKDVLPPIEEINKQFRLNKQPIILFGETIHDRWHRLQNLQISRTSDDHIYKNDLKEAMKQAEDNIFLQTLNSKYEKSDKINNDLDNIDFSYFENLTHKLGKGDTEFDMKTLMDFICFILSQQNAKLDKIPICERSSFKSKSDRANLIQTTHYLEPLMESIKKKNLSYDLIDSMTKILIFLIDKSYILANSAYLELAIGNAPWPIGVTMSGIHNRPGKDRIASKNVAHVLNDETQRKYLQALKRIMRWCQELFPAVPSKSMDYYK